MRVQTLADAANVTADTVRHYTRIGLLTPVKNPANGYKEYTSEDLQRLSFIVRARDLGFGLNDIEQIFDRADHGDSPCPMVREAIEERLVEVKRKLDEMTELYERMKKAVEDWTAMPDSQPCGKHLCHLIEGVDVESETKLSGSNATEKEVN